MPLNSCYYLLFPSIADYSHLLESIFRGFKMQTITTITPKGSVEKSINCRRGQDVSENGKWAKREKAPKSETAK